jgi:hypothetical protein
MSVDPIEYMLKDPDRRAKLYLLAVGALIMSTIFIVIGMIILILLLLKII